MMGFCQENLQNKIFSQFKAKDHLLQCIALVKSSHVISLIMVHCDRYCKPLHRGKCII